MTTAWHDLQHEPITWEMFLDIDEDVRRDLEIVDGYVVPREQRSRDHQKVSTRLSLALETAAVQQMRKTGGVECYETNTEVDVLLWEAPPTARKPDAVLHRCIPDAEQLAAGHVLIAAEVLSTWSGRRDRVHKMSDYADAGIPHYWLISFDKVGVVTIERYALAGGVGRYVHVGTSHRDMGPTAVNISAPFPVEILWADLEVAPRVLANLGRVSGSWRISFLRHSIRQDERDPPTSVRRDKGSYSARVGLSGAGCRLRVCEMACWRCQRVRMVTGSCPLWCYGGAVAGGSQGPSVTL